MGQSPTRLENLLKIFLSPIWSWLTKGSSRRFPENFLTPPFWPLPKRLPKSLISTRKSYQNDGFGSILVQIWTHFGSFLTPFWAKNGPPSGARFKRKHKEFTLFLHFQGDQKGSISGALFGPLFGLHFTLFWGPLFGLPKSLFFLVLNPGPGPGVRKSSPAPGLLKTF